MMNNLIHFWMVYMGDVATFLLATTLVLTLLYVPYTLLLRKEHFFRQNRFTLLAILVLSLVLPFCDVHALYPGELLAGLFSKPAPEAVVEFSSTEQIASATTPLEPIEFTEAHIGPLGLLPWLCQLYVVGTLIVLAIRLWQFARMRRLITSLSLVFAMLTTAISSTLYITISITSVLSICPSFISTLPRTDSIATTRTTSPAEALRPQCISL